MKKAVIAIIVMVMIFILGCVPKPAVVDGSQREPVNKEVMKLGAKK